MKDFVTIYRWRILNPETPYNVQIFLDNHCESSQDFKTHDEACIFANSQNLPVINQITEEDLEK